MEKGTNGQQQQQQQQHSIFTDEESPFFNNTKVSAILMEVSGFSLEFFKMCLYPNSVVTGGFQTRQWPYFSPFCLCAKNKKDDEEMRRQDL